MTNWKTVVVHSTVLSQHCLGRTEEHQGSPQIGFLAYGVRPFESVVGLLTSGLRLGTWLENLHLHASTLSCNFQ